MSTETIKRSDVGEEEAKAAETKPDELDLQDESASKSEAKPQDTAVKDIPDGVQDGEPSGEAENDKTDKPEVKSEVDWENVAKRERYKRQRKNEELEELREEKAQAAQPDPRISSDRPKRPRQYDKGIDGDEDKLDDAMELYDEQVYQWREKTRIREDATKRAGEQSANYQRQIETYAETNPEYGQAWEDAGKPKLPGHVDQALMRTDLGPKIEHYLYDNPEKLGEVMKAEPIDAVMMISNIRFELSSKSASPAKGKEKPKRRTISDAPEPASQTRGSSAKEDGFAAAFPNAKVETGYA